MRQPRKHFKASVGGTLCSHRHRTAGAAAGCKEIGDGCDVIVFRPDGSSVVLADVPKHFNAFPCAHCGEQFAASRLRLGVCRGCRQAETDKKSARKARLASCRRVEEPGAVAAAVADFDAFSKSVREAAGC